MITKLIIKEPNPYWSYLDEKNFFEWLESIPAIKKVIGIGTSLGLEIYIKTPLNEPNLRDLIAILHKYGIDKKCLREFATSENEKWFKDNNSYWYKSVFEN